MVQDGKHWWPEIHGQISSLPSELASVFLTTSVERYSYAETAELFDIPVDTVMSRLHRARRAPEARIAEAEGVGQ